jgi:type IV secretory pathway VirB10-like protein
MPIENRNLEPGTVLVARYKKQERTCEVVQTDDGLRYRLDDGREFKSPSSAGKAAIDGVACNGWRFWSLQGTEPKREPKAKADKPKKEPAAEKPTKPKAAATPTSKARPKNAAKKPAKKKPAKKAKAQRASSKSDAYGCGACGETFGSQKAAVAHAMTHTS